MSVIIGIDFGTTGMRVAVILDGNPVVLENEEGEGTTPAYIAFNGLYDIKIGEDAKRIGAYSSDVVWAIKRLVGRKWEDPIVQAVIAASIYPLAKTSDEEISLIIAGEIVSISAICTHFFERIKKIASFRLGTEISQAVLAVPTHFRFEQVLALKAAAAAAGINVLRFVPEPTAAALYHGFGDAEQTVAIYDLGGGTFDISILRIGHGVFEVVGSDGDPFLGGEDFDLRLRDHILKIINMKLENISIASRYRIKRAAENAKISLSGQMEHHIIEENLTTAAGRHFFIDIIITREQICDLFQDLVDRTLAVCARAIEGADREQKRSSGRKDSGFRLEEIDKVILVGGSSRLAIVEDNVQRFFGKKPTAPIRREDAVSLGCAIQAGVLSGAVKTTLLLDVASRDYGVRIGNQKAEMLVGRNMTIPTKRSITFEGADQTAPIDVSAVEIEPNGNEIVVASISNAAAVRASGVYRLKITLEVDANGMLRLDAADIFSDSKNLTQRKFIGDDEEEKNGPKPQGASASYIENLSKTNEKASNARILSVGTEWRSGAGGLSSLNRSLCLALAADGHDVACMVLDAEPSDIALAHTQGVRIIKATRGAGQSDQVALARKPRLPDGWIPNIIIGHGRITGPAALAISEDHFPSAKRLHILHMAPDEIEWFKPDRGDDAGARAEERSRIERELGAGADYAAAVGPRLHARFLTDLHAVGRKPFRLDPGFDGVTTPPLGPPPGYPLRILLVGRAEDETLKGLDIAARSVGLLHSRWTEQSLSLEVRGAPIGTSRDLRNKLIKWADSPGLIINVKPYNAMADHLDADYRSASLVLMPSRSEGFGLVGLEAICVGVPVLISSESGLGEFLRDKLPSKISKKIVIPVTGDLQKDAERWSYEIERILLERDVAFKSASEMLEDLRKSRTWALTSREIRNKIWK